MNQTIRPLSLAKWLFSVAFLVVAIVIVGGITRLTESGLSITEWKPVSGMLPPMSDAAWAEAFRKYQQIPEYQEINKGMSLSAFKFIFFWEWVHRVLGRVIGLALVLPWLWLVIRRALPKSYAWRIFLLCALVGLQGAIGWWMVSSGLEIRTDVSHYRLAAHLLTALTVLAGLVWTGLDLLALEKGDDRPARLPALAGLVIPVLFIQLLFGAYIAGLNAGQVANSWPLMNGSFVPEGIDWTSGAVAAFGNDPFLIHFFHRWWAWVTLGVLFILARRTKSTGQRGPSLAIHITAGTMILLGIATVLTGVNITIAVLHQAMGALVVIATGWGLHSLGKASQGERKE